MIRTPLLALAALSLLTASCVTAPPVAAPVLEYAANNSCAATPDLSSAASLIPERPRAQYIVTAAVTQAAACLTRAERSATPYLLYALPAASESRTFTAGALLEPARIFAPHVSLLDANGVVVRDFDSTQFMYRGPVYSVQFRPRAGEAYLLFTAEPMLVGQRYNSVAIGTQTASAYTTVGAVSWTSGVDNTQSRTFSYEGGVQVIVYDPSVH